MHTKVTGFAPDSPLSKTIIAPGDVLRRISGKAITDVLDYDYYSYDSRLLLEFTESDQKIKLIRIQKPVGESLGLIFEEPLMDKERSCGNKCIFCFIDQLPKGMRETLYYKDDDVRLSLLHGNYITLTNLCGEDIKRIIEKRISPINLSIHTLNPSLRLFMLGKDVSEPLPEYLNYPALLARAGIKLNCQIVCCPEINDREELSETMRELTKLGRSINSVSVVPVGLTRHREGLFWLKPFDKNLALDTVTQVERHGRRHLKKYGSRVFYCADELYMMAGLKLPPHRYYEDYPQLENGVGMMRLFIYEFFSAMKNYRGNESLAASSDSKIENKGNNNNYSIATGTLAAPYLTKLLHVASRKYDTIAVSRGTALCKVHAIRNDFFGESVTVSGLVTGGDIIAQLKGKELGAKLLIPSNMLRKGEDVFLDDVMVQDLSNTLGVPVKVVGQSGADLFNALLEAADA